MAASAGQIDRDIAADVVKSGKAFVTSVA